MSLPDYNSDLCPSCCKAMSHVRTIWRGSQASEVRECRSCGVTVTQAAAVTRAAATAKPQASPTAGIGLSASDPGAED